MKKTAPSPAEIRAGAIRELEIRQTIAELQAASLRRQEAANGVAPVNRYADKRPIDPTPAERLLALQPRPVAIHQKGREATTADTTRVLEPITPSKAPTAAMLPETDKISLAGLGLAPQEIGQDWVETSLIDDVGARDLLESFSLDGNTLEQSEKSIFADDTYLKSGNFEEEDEASIDNLPDDVEPGTRLAEAEYVSELLVGLFADLVSIELPEEPSCPIDPESAGTAEAETQESNPPGFEIAMPPARRAEFSAYLESLEPAQVETTKNFIEALSGAVHESQRLSEEITPEEQENIEQNIEVLCARLFEYLGIEYDEETLAWFIQNIKTFESSPKIEADELAVDSLNNMGTQEYKPLGGASVLHGLARFIRQTAWPHSVLGRYALQATAA